MKQVLINRGKAIVSQIPAPKVSDNGVLVEVAYSCISAGTEMSEVIESGKSIVKKAIEQPDQIKKALNLLTAQGIDSVLGKVKEKELPKLTGYSAAGIVIGLGKNIFDLKIGDKVACAGAGFANHAEYIDVPRSLVMKIPKGLTMDLASTVTIGGIAMQGVRRADLRLGEIAAVIGMGTLGQLSAQILKASGCKIICIDVDERRLKVAKETTDENIINSLKCDVTKEIEKITEGYGVDAVIITTATNSNNVLSQAFNICRKKGKVVLVGIAGNEYKRDDMYKKELDFIISTSYGPGRYDPSYEEKCIDYPYAYVRWTENRNMEEYLRLVAENRINLQPLIERIYDINKASEAYEELKNAQIKPLIVLLKYNEDQKEKEIKTNVVINNKLLKDNGKINVAVIGAGSFAKSMHLPNLKKLSNIYNVYAIMSKTGTNSKLIAEEYGAKYATTDYNEILNDSNVDMVLICTRHNLHADMSIEAMKKGKAVFVEKPMALNREEMKKVLITIEGTKVPYMVGFNRRFSKYATEAKKHIKDRINPIIINYQMNAGFIPLDNWVHSDDGGGRIIGEACHIFDLFNYFTDSKAISISVDSINPCTKNVSQRDNVIVTIKYDDGSLCSLIYTSLGSNVYPKELCQIYCDGKIITIEDYKKINGYNLKVSNIRSKIPEKGQYEELIEFANVVKNSEGYSIPIWQLEQTSEISYLVAQEVMK